VEFSVWEFSGIDQERGTLRAKGIVECQAVTDIPVTCKPIGVAGDYCTITIDGMVWYGMAWRLEVGRIESTC
jgi:hypothetical protein